MFRFSVLVPSLPRRVFSKGSSFLVLALLFGFGGNLIAQADDTSPAPVHYRTLEVAGVKVFYREAGPAHAPVVLLLHGFPTSSHQFRDLIPPLAKRYHVIAPDYPGFGQSEAPPASAFAYTFEHLTDVIDAFTQKLELKHYSLFVHDYGAPVGFRLALRHPERVQVIITQNGNAYDEGLTSFWDVFRNDYWKHPTPANADALRGSFKLETTRSVAQAGARNPERIAPDFWIVSQAGLDRPGNQEIQLALFLDYRTNPPLYAEWQKYFREKQPPTLIVWGKNDPIFGAAGAIAFLRDLKHGELHLLDTGHFALEEEGDLIAQLMLRFLDRTVGPKTEEGSSSLISTDDSATRRITRRLEISEDQRILVFPKIGSGKVGRAASE
jgi:pimeloyl-ACP methyl ester carboxylesterase